MISQYLTFVLDNHLYWNGGTAIPENSSELINYTDDSSRLVADPQIPAPVNVVLPRWQESSGLFGDGSSTIRAAFENLVSYAVPGFSSQLIGRANDTSAPADDILGNLRSSPKDIGSFEYGANASGGGFSIVPINSLLLLSN
jgi:hypothetical protein